MPEQPPHLSVQIKHHQGALPLDVEFTLTQPWTVLFGPSGSGKTTVLRAIVGLLRPDRGRIVMSPRASGQTLVDTNAKVFLPAHRRPVRFSAQSPTLFPEMSIQANIAYGVARPSERTQGTTQTSVVDDALNRFALQSLASKRPENLSGGERQRVAVVRAAASAVSLGPGTLLLLDEPFTGLDLGMRDELLHELQDWLQAMQVPVLSVTHDVGEAFQLGAEVVRIGDGRVVGQGAVEAVLEQERQRVLSLLR